MPIKKKYYALFANTTEKIKLKGERKGWFGLLPVFYSREDTHCLNSLVPGVPHWTQQRPPQERSITICTPRYTNNFVFSNWTLGRTFYSAVLIFIENCC